MESVLTILGIAPVWIFTLSAFGIARKFQERGSIGQGLTLAGLMAFVATGVVFQLVAELAAVTHIFNAGFVQIAWGLADIFAFVFWLKLRNRRGVSRDLGSPWGRLRGWVRDQGADIVVLYAGAWMVIALAGVVALNMPATIWDTQTYHMPRVMQWIQQGSLAPFASNSQRQIESSPGAEIQIAQLLLLTGRWGSQHPFWGGVLCNDRAANFPQWMALITVTLGAGWLSKELLRATPLRSGKRDQRMESMAAGFGMILAGTLPSAVSWAVTSKNDLLAASWAISAIVWGWLLLTQPRNRFYLAMVACSLALAVGTKPTAFVYLGAFLIFPAGSVFRSRAYKTGLLWAVSAGMVLVMLNGWWLCQNYKTFGHPLGSRTMFKMLRNERITPGKIAANIVRNLSFYTATPSDDLTAGLNSVLEFTMRSLRQDPADPGSVFPSGFGFARSTCVLDGNGLGHIYPAAAIAIALLIYPWKFRASGLAVPYLLTVAAAFVLFCAYLKWQPWHARFHVFHLAAAVPFAAAVFAASLPRAAGIGIAANFCLNAVLVLWFNPETPVAQSLVAGRSRGEILYALRPQDCEPTKALAQAICESGYTNVLLVVADDTAEYPLWREVLARGFAGQIHHALVQNETRGFETALLNAPSTAVIVKGPVLASPNRNPDPALRNAFPVSTRWGTWQLLERNQP